MGLEKMLLRFVSKIDDKDKILELLSEVLPDVTIKLDRTDLKLVESLADHPFLPVKYKIPEELEQASDRQITNATSGDYRSIDENGYIIEDDDEVEDREEKDEDEGDNDNDNDDSEFEEESYSEFAKYVVSWIIEYRKRLSVAIDETKAALQADLITDLRSQLRDKPKKTKKHLKE